MHSSPRILITAGPTHEPIDAVRYIANRSSGRMGMALAEASLRRSWPTTLLLGPIPLEPPKSSQLHVLRFQSTADLSSLLRDQWPLHDVLFMAAAVADYRPKLANSAGKLRRSHKPINLQFVPTPDLLAELSTITRPDQIAIGFALEPEHRLEDSAREKLLQKDLYAIVANPLDTIESPTVSATVLLRDGTNLPTRGQMAKSDFAPWLLTELEKVWSADHESNHAH